jgi:hypothetical protein
MSEKKKPGPKGGEKPMGKIPEPSLEDQVAILRERIAALEKDNLKMVPAVNELTMHHFRRKTV